MSEHHDFAIDAEASKPAAESPKSPPAQPLVVVEYRRGLSSALIPPLLILLAALLIVSYQRQTPVRPLAPAQAASTARGATGQSRIIMVEPSGSGAAVEPIDVRPENRFGPPAPASSPSSAPAQAAVDPADPTGANGAAERSLLGDDRNAEGPRSPFDPDPARPGSVARKRGVNPRSKPAPTPGEAPAIARAEPVEPLPTREQFEQDLRREAEEKQIEMREMEAIKRDASSLELREIYQRAQDERIPFLKELRFRVQTLGMKAGPEIRNLCTQYGRNTSPIIEERVVRELNRKVRLSYPAKVELMRQLGLPETMILDLLSKEMDHLRTTRNGPRDQNEVRVLAARILLNVPFPPRSTPPSGAAPRSGDPASGNSVAGVAPSPGPGAVRRPQ
jgi:hypothetical protein